MFSEPEHDDSVANLFDLQEPSFDDAPDSKVAKEIITRSLPPSGTYLRDPDTLGNLTVLRQGKDFDDPRRMIILSGRFQATIKGKEHTAFVRNIKLSPDRRPAKEFKDGQPTGNFLDKDDTATVLWAKAVNVYLKTFKELPESNEGIIAFLESGSYKAKIRAFNGELYLNDLLPLKG